MSDSVRPHRQQPARLPRPWDSPGKNTGVGCHFLLQCMKVKSESEVAQSCLTLSDPMDCSLPGSSVHGIFQARVLEWGAIAFSGYSLVGCKELDTIEHTCTYLCTSLYATSYTFIHIHKYVHTNIHTHLNNIALYMRAQSRPTPGNVAARFLCLWNFPGTNIGVGCHFLLQGIFLIQGQTPCLLHLLH